MQLQAPLYLVGAAVASILVAVAHLLALRAPRPIELPTARFVPDLVSESLSRRFSPSDLLLLCLRVLALVTVGLALSRPSLTFARSGRGVLLVVDRTGGVSALDSARAIASRSRVSRLVLFDSVASVAPLDSLVAGREVAREPGTLSPALVVAAREVAKLRKEFDSVAVIIVTPLWAEQLDAATQSIRNEIDASIEIVRPVSRRSATAPRSIVAPPLEHPVGAAAALSTGSRGDVRVKLGPATAADSAAARAGATIVAWPDQLSDEKQLHGLLTRSHASAVGYFQPDSAFGGAGRPIAWLETGAPAAFETALGAGCLRTVAIRLPRRGDLALQNSFVRAAMDLHRACGDVDATLAPDSALRQLEARPAERQLALAADTGWSKWLLLLAGALLVVEWLVRRSGEARS